MAVDTSNRADSPASEEPGTSVECAVKTGGFEVGIALSRLACEASAAHDVLAAHMWLFDEATRTMRLVGGQGESMPSPEPVDVDHSSLGEPIVSGTAHLAGGEDVRGRRTWRYAFPVASGEVRGAVAIDVAAEEADAVLLMAVASRNRQALASALAAHVAHEERRFATAVVDRTCRLVRLLDRDAILDELLDAALDISQAENGSVLLLDESRQALKIAVSRGLPAHVVAESRIVPGDGIAGWVYATGEPLVIEDLDDKGPRGRRHGVRSAAVVPLADESGSLGVVNVGSTRFQAALSDSRLAALRAISNAASVALRNAEALASRHDLFLETVRALALALEVKDPYCHGATDRVLELATVLGEILELSDADVVALKTGAMLHDIGMSAAAEDATHRDRPLDTYEWGMLKMHPVIAADVLRQSAALRDAIPVVYHHHEHYDGGGYLQGIAGEKIPLGARILAVADAYVAMTSPRPYREPLSHPQAIGELQDKSGSQFDPSVVAALIAYFGESPPAGPEVDPA